MKDIIRLAEERNEFVYLEDGFLYYWPSSQGAIPAYQLRQLADELDRRNKDWNEQINRYFEENKK